MRYKICRLSLLRAFAFSSGFLLLCAAAGAQLSGTIDFDVSRKVGNDSECAIAKNPNNAAELFAACNTAAPGLLAVRSIDGGKSWNYVDPNDKVIADGDPQQGPPALCDPSVAWDTFGNLFLTYIDESNSEVVAILSKDGGQNFSELRRFRGSIDQPTVAAAPTSPPVGASGSVWIVWNLSGHMVATGAPVRGLGLVGRFREPKEIPGTENCSFGDVAIAPSGAVIQVCETPTDDDGPATIRVSRDGDGLGSGNFAQLVDLPTNVGGLDRIPAQFSKCIDAAAGLAFDRDPASPHFGRLYLVYTDETVNESNDTDIMLRWSEDNGATWSSPKRVNDDSPASPRSQFLPRVAVDDTSGSVSVCWLDCRNSDTNKTAQLYCTTASASGAAPAFLANVAISDGTSTSSGIGYEFGDYTGLAYRDGVAHPIWPDSSNSTANNPDAKGGFDALTDRVTVTVSEPQRGADQPGEPIPSPIVRTSPPSPSPIRLPTRRRRGSGGGR